jgi:predicted alpha/beta hydrolase family esterase
MNSANVLILPGWQSSGPDHWQSRWEALHGYTRVEQHEWMRPLRGDWTARLEEVLLQCSGPVILVAHSLGCLLVAAWSAHSRNTHLVKAALMVAPGDVEREALRPMLASWSPICQQSLPFRSCLVSSRNDPYCTEQRARQFANAWGSEFVDYGDVGHINAESGLGVWDEGHEMLIQLDRQETELEPDGQVPGTVEKDKHGH